MSYYKMIAREDMEAHMKSLVMDLEKQRNRMYSALDVLPSDAKHFEDRDALNHEIAASIGEQRAWRKMWDWLQENYPRESATVSQAQLKDQIDGVQPNKYGENYGI